MRRAIGRGMLAVLVFAGCLATQAVAQAPRSVFLEDLTWTELRDQIRSGKTTIIIPVGGVEQSGPDIALGKHDVRARLLAGRIAGELGNAIVAPVVAYVPEGSISPPTAHMRFPGTITVPPEVFRQMLVSAALSFQLHGFKDVVLVGDHGGYQADLKAVADQLNRKWAGSGTRAHFVAEYYQATQTAYVAALRGRGYSAAEIGTHAGLADTSLMLALDPRQVREQGLKAGDRLGEAYGVHGDPRRSTAQLGRLGVDEIVRETVKAVRAETVRR